MTPYFVMLSIAVALIFVTLGILMHDPLKRFVNSFGDEPEDGMSAYHRELVERHRRQDRGTA
jgi:hypothetical protein